MTTRLKVTVKEGVVKDALLALTSTQRTLVMEKALLYYARHLEENPQITDPLFDAEKVNSTEIFEPFKKERKVLSEEEKLKREKEVADIMEKYLAKDCEEKGQVELRRERLKAQTTAVQFHMETDNEKVKRMLSYARSVSSSITGLVIRALEYYIDLVKNDEGIKDFNLEKQSIG